MNRFRPLLFLALLIPLGALAQTAGTPVNIDIAGATQNDLSIKMMQAMLGDTSGNSIVPGIGEAMRVFNAIVMTFCVTLFFYVSVVGIMQTAHDGQVLGKNWSSMWVPARLVAGTAVLAPTASGYSMIQLFIIWVASMGVGSANLIWSAYVNSAASPQMISVRMADAADIKTSMSLLFSAETCVADHNRRQATVDETYGYSRVVPAFAINVDGNPAKDVLRNASRGSFLSSHSVPTLSWGRVRDVHFKPQPGEELPPMEAAPPDACGSVTFPTSMSNAGESGAYIAQQRDAILDAATTILRPAAERLVAEASEQREKISDAEIENAIETAANYYSGRMGAARGAGFSGNVTDSILGAAKESAAKNGWINAGLWFFQMAQYNSAINEVSAYPPAVQGPKIKTTADGDYRAPPADAHVEAKLKTLADTKNRTSPVVTDMRNANVKSGADASKTTASSVLAGAATPLAGPLGSGIAMSAALFSGTGDNLSQWAGHKIGYDPENRDHPIVQLKNTGDNLMVAGQMAMAGAGAASLTSGGVAGKLITGIKMILPVGGIVEYVGVFMFILAMALLTFGMMASIYLPMVPFIVWAGVVMSWLATVIEMMIATPLWAAAHMTPEGEGMAGKYGANGYMIVVEIFSKPVLFIFGLIGAIMISEPIFQWVGYGFWTAQKSVQSNSLTGLLSVLAFAMLYISFCIALMHKVFSLIHIIPGVALRWIGAHWNSAFDQGGQLAQELQHGTAGGFQQGKGILTQTATTVRNRRDAASQKAQKDYVDEQRAGAAAAQANSNSAGKKGSD